MTTIKLKNGSGAPATSDLVQGEPALDLTNKRLYTENASGTIIEVGTNPTSLTTGTFTSTGIDDNATSTAITIDSSENVGIGTASPNAYANYTTLTLNGATSSALDFEGGGTLMAEVLATANDLILQTAQSDGELIFRSAAGSEAMRIDSSGNLGLGTPAPSSYGGGFVVDDLGINIVTASSSSPGTNKLSWWSDNNGISQNAYISTVNDGATTNTGEMVFYTKNSSATLAERMRIASNGYLLIGTTTVPNGSADGIAFHPGSSGRILSGGSTGTFNQVLFYNPNGSVGSIQTSGSATAYNTSSDVRLKENITDAPAGNIDSIRVRSFDWKADGSHQTYGMIAQELVEAAPEAVAQGETEEDMWGVDYSKLVPMMIKEIQDLKAEVAALKGE